MHWEDAARKHERETFEWQAHPRDAPSAVKSLKLFHGNFNLKSSLTTMVSKRTSVGQCGQNTRVCLRSKHDPLQNGPHGNAAGVLDSCAAPPTPVLVAQHFPVARLEVESARPTYPHVRPLHSQKLKTLHEATHDRREFIHNTFFFKTPRSSLSDLFPCSGALSSPWPRHRFLASLDAAFRRVQSLKRLCPVSLRLTRLSIARDLF